MTTVSFASGKDSRQERSLQLRAAGAKRHPGFVQSQTAMEAALCRAGRKPVENLRTEGDERPVVFITHCSTGLL